MSVHAAASEAHHYWRQFEVMATWDKHPKLLAGTIVELGQTKVDNEFVPRLRIQDERGVVTRVIVTQERLLAALVEAAPRKGAYVQITYTGDAPKAARGMTPAKLFTVELKGPK